MTKTTTSDGSNNLVSEISNMYNGDGQRIKKTVKKGTGTNQVTDVNNYYYQNGVVSYTTDDSDNKTSHNLIGAEGNIISTKRYGTYEGYYSYNKDLQGSIMTVLGSDGGFKTGYEYSDFGETSKYGDENFYNEVCYTGGIYDESTELYYLNARYYDSVTSRMLTVDTYRGEKSEPQSLHLYSYCENDPINFIDPSGYRKKKSGDKHKKCPKTRTKTAKVKLSKLKAVVKKYKSSVVPGGGLILTVATAYLNKVAATCYVAWSGMATVWNKQAKRNAKYINSIYKKYKKYGTSRNVLIINKTRHVRKGNDHSYVPSSSVSCAIEV